MHYIITSTTRWLGKAFVFIRLNMVCYVVNKDETVRLIVKLPQHPQKGNTRRTSRYGQRYVHSVSSDDL